MFRRLFIIGVSLSLLVAPFGGMKASAEELEVNILISEVQTTGIDLLGADDGKKEFIELYNRSDTEIDVSTWRVQYFSATRADVFTPSSEPTREIAILDGTIEANGYVLLSYIDYLSDADVYFGEGSTASSGLLAKSGGHLRILSADNTILDIVGWGSASSPETKSISVIDGGESAVRMVDMETGLHIDTGNNYLDFQITNVPTPTGGSLSAPEIPVETEEETPACDGIVISEILPNPVGTDTGLELIELYNPTEETVLLEDCELSIISGKKIFTFEIGSRLESKQFLALTDQITGLVLPNASGGALLLAGTNTEFVVQYPPALAANNAWAMFETGWAETDRPTPGSDNLPSAPEPLEIEDVEELAPCPTGKIRNPDTNRCRNIQDTASSLAPCSSGQVRNPETNRCRSLGSVVAALVPCREGQERNPETNRCRNVLSAATTVACQEGYERNPETNRCRKVQAAKAPLAAGNISKDSAQRRISKVFIVLASLAVLGYGAYEYRRDLANAAYKFRKRFTGNNTVE